MVASQKSEWFLTLPRRVICERINTCEKPMVPQWCWLWCFWWWSLRTTMIKTVMVLLMMVMDSQEVLKLFRLALQTIQALQSIRSEMVSSWLPLTSSTMRIESGRKRLMCWTSEAGTWSLQGHLVILWLILLQQLELRCQALPGPEWVWTLPAHLGCRSPTRGVTQKNNVDDPPGNQHIPYLHTLEDDFPFPKCSFPGGYFVLRQRVRRPEQASSFTLLDCSGKVGKWMAWSLLMFMALGQDPLLCRMSISTILLRTL